MVGVVCLGGNDESKFPARFVASGRFIFDCAGIRY
jgi:hypothetical protein